MTTETADRESKATRPWRLRGYGTDKKLRHQSTCRGDQALDEALSRLEADPNIVRVTAERTW